MERNQKAVCTTALIVINIGVFLVLSVLGATEDTLFMLEHGAMYGPYVVEGHQYYRIFTCLFLHFGIEHLLNNMVLLGALGWNLELETGRIKFLILYFISGLGGMVVLSLSFGFTSSGVDNAAHVGGLVCGFVMAAVLYRRQRGAAGTVFYD